MQAQPFPLLVPAMRVIWQVAASGREHLVVLRRSAAKQRLKVSVDRAVVLDEPFCGGELSRFFELPGGTYVHLRFDPLKATAGTEPNTAVHKVSRGVIEGCGSQPLDVRLQSVVFVSPNLQLRGFQQDGRRS